MEFQYREIFPAATVEVCLFINFFHGQPFHGKTAAHFAAVAFFPNF